MLIFHQDRVATVREKSLENEFFSRSGKVREFQFLSGKFRKNNKSQGKVREFEKFPKKSIGKKVLKIIIFINCK